MKSRAPLALMEAIVMLAVFALAAALCMQAFVRSDQMSKENEARDRAAVICQSVAEQVRCSGGDLKGALESAATGEYRVQAEEVPSGVAGLGKARVWVTDETDAVLFELDVGWQREVSGRGA